MALESIALIPRSMETCALAMAGNTSLCRIHDKTVFIALLGDRLGMPCLTAFVDWISDLFSILFAHQVFSISDDSLSPQHSLVYILKGNLHREVSPIHNLIILP